MRGLSPRNLKYNRAFAVAWPDRSIVQEALAQIPWLHQIALLEKLDRREQLVRAIDLTGLLVAADRVEGAESK